MFGYWACMSKWNQEWPYTQNKETWNELSGFRNLLSDISVTFWKIQKRKCLCSCTLLLRSVAELFWESCKICRVPTGVPCICACCCFADAGCFCWERSSDWLGYIVFQSDGVHFHIAVTILHKQFADWLGM
jgi:hypothetical protein